MALKDLATLEKVFDKRNIEEADVIKKAMTILEKGEMLYGKIDDKEEEILKQYQLLTLKPRFFLLNGSQEELTDKIKNDFENNDFPYIVVDILNEFEIGELKDEEKKDLGITDESKLDLLIKKAYQLLDLITFLTTGSDETRAWTLKQGSAAPQAGGAIHTDFEDNFIKADVINWQDLINVGGIAQAREKGLIRTEGKNYIIQDGNVIEIKHGA